MPEPQTGELACVRVQFKFFVFSSFISPRFGLAASFPISVTVFYGGSAA